MKTPPTVPAPLPTDHRILRLAGLLNLSKRETIGAVVETWAWLHAQAHDGVVPQPLVLLDTVAEIEGFGEAAVAVGLVGTADGHIVAPAELRQAQGTARRAGTADDEKRKEYEREKKRKQRKGSRLTGKPKPTTPKGDAPAAATTPSRRARRLGTVAPGQDVLLLWSKQNGEWFYKVTGATPTLTGTVSDQENPTLADALKALLDARLTQVQKTKGSLDIPTFSPSMEQLVEAARREQADRQAAAVAAARVNEGNVAFDHAAADDDQGDADWFSITTDCNAKSKPKVDAPSDATEPVNAHQQDASAGDNLGTTGGQHGDMGTCPQNVPGTPTGERVVSPSNDNGLDAARCPPKCPHDATGTVPSSSSSSMSYGIENKDTTTTRTTADHERDTTRDAEQGDDFSRYLTATKAATASGETFKPLDPETAAHVQRLADALGDTTDAVRRQGRQNPGLLDARLRALGIDPKTGHPLPPKTSTSGKRSRSHEDAPGSPASVGTSVQTGTDVQPSGDVLAAPATTATSGGSTTPTGAAHDDADDLERDHEEPVTLTAADIDRRRREVLQAVRSYTG
jgi:nucleotide-binding universal stress UspA family protein